MNSEEANKIIAEFMLGYKIQEGVYMGYDISLDALVPVWRKLNEESYLNITIISDTMDAFHFFFDYFSTQKSSYESPLGQTIQEAAAIATARAIKEMQNDD